jgi:nucleoside-diphosphate-sugar epimerase
VKAAVTGGSGFVGSHLVDLLRQRGDAVACLARSAAAAAELGRRGCRVVTGSLDDESAIESLVQGADIVFHVAGLVAARDEAEFLRVNRDGTGRVARAARGARVRRVVYVSSLAVTGPTQPGRPLDESAPPRPVTPYGRSKAAGEASVRAAGVPFTIIRPPAVYGPRDRELLRVFVMARRGIAPLLGDGSQELSLVYAADLARALVAAADSPATAGRVYHAAHPEGVTQRALVTAIARALGRPMSRPVQTVAIPPAVVRALLHLSGALARLRGAATLLSPDKADELLAPAWTCSSEALARDAGWRAAVALEEGLAETARWYREAGWL